MLATLEELLAHAGIDELHLHVNIANEPARRLYAAAGYEVGEALPPAQARRLTIGVMDVGVGGLGGARLVASATVAALQRACCDPAPTVS